VDLSLTDAYTKGVLMGATPTLPWRNWGLLSLGPGHKFILVGAQKETFRAWTAWRRGGRRLTSWNRKDPRNESHIRDERKVGEKKREVGGARELSK